MIEISSSGGAIAVGKFSFTWSNTDDVFDWPGFTIIGWGDTFLEFGDVDNGNGIFLTRYKDGDIEFTKAILRI